MKFIKNKNLKKPSYVQNLEKVYGPPNQEAFGSAVFHEVLKDSDLAEEAQNKYRYFVGDLWERYGEEAWLSAWKQIYTREQDTESDIVKELKDISDFDASMSIDQFLESVENPEEAQSALKTAFDDPVVNKLFVYTVGDGEAMSGILIAALRKKNDEGTFLVFLMD